MKTHTPNTNQAEDNLQAIQQPIVWLTIGDGLWLELRLTCKVKLSLVTNPENFELSASWEYYGSVNGPLLLWLLLACALLFLYFSGQ